MADAAAAYLRVVARAVGWAAKGGCIWVGRDYGRMVNFPVTASKNVRNEVRMKKKASPDLGDDLRPEYGAELFSRVKPNRFANADLKFKGRRAVYLDEDVAQVFDTPEAVNTVLRSAIRAMRRVGPRHSAKAPRAKRRAS